MTQFAIEPIALDDLPDRPVSIVKERKAKYKRYREMKTKVDLWLKGLVEVRQRTPCHCGGRHSPLRVWAGLEADVICPVIWWGWIALLRPDSRPCLEVIMKQASGSIMSNIPEGVPDEELDRWVKYYKVKGETALVELDKIAPKISAAIRKILEERRIEAARALWPDDDGI